MGLFWTTGDKFDREQLRSAAAFLPPFYWTAGNYGRHLEMVQGQLGLRPRSGRFF